ncbi:hypothetical protein E4T42_02390 [Aureobasidium subglaciale]|uniref:Uncharacterized protein n=1 Tax=Aureobasidium subglaciale (strain EXF-2481) TaxID=1043005 RepID=A0A074Z6G4_AURSE|nr:uncharacterized protein AUEXF2481DRAFT_30500 [Aureobasidium subglaciale EXF-2481]KAI5196760.1 hypothetical protein E4T38_08346 [Aureobasidium subglaciale]KAI5214154.1 hypothetical protein E4T40_09191 [Aureobasidium subglaciale]KAI5216700.1 hypothetical protein E4T41_09192 [Aureobasidium subglaciale]KAI5254391.1 hypothetical protein E4T42_02390 [Aureobasidium subglaciale]KAI5256431.1 hypothetical protein E4T46_08246 [Aureobasidium subglaciale]
MGDTAAAVVWGVPVKPVDLIVSLDALRKASPAIQTLRLCHQFGKGKDAHVAKLPKEIIVFIEEELLAMHRVGKEKEPFSLPGRYCCFEGSCRPSDHMHHVDHVFPKEDYEFEYASDDSEAYEDDYESLADTARAELCEAHPEWRTKQGLVLPANFPSLLHAKIADIFDINTSEEVHELCFMSKVEWEDDVRDYLSTQGNSEIIRKYFSLNVFIMCENLSDSTKKYLCDCDERFSKVHSDPEKVAICYLVLPSRSTKWEVRLDPISRESGSYYGESATSMLVDRNSLDLTEEHQQRFARAMSRLALKPSVHPSQLQTTLLASCSMTASSPSLMQYPRRAKKEQPSAEDIEKKHTAITGRIRDMEKTHWPKLMLLVNHNCHEF